MSIPRAASTSLSLYSRDIITTNQAAGQRNQGTIHFSGSHLFERGDIGEEMQQEVRFADAGNDRYADHPKHHLENR